MSDKPSPTETPERRDTPEDAVIDREIERRELPDGKYMAMLLPLPVGISLWILVLYGLVSLGLDLAAAGA